MKKSEFMRLLNKDIFSDRDFTYYKDHFYKEITSEISIVFGFQKSSYGDHGYIERGYCFKSINKYMPYPRFNELNLNCGRIMTPFGTRIEYQNIDQPFYNSLKQIINKEIDLMISLVEKGCDELIQYYFNYDGSWYILGERTAAYFGKSFQDFKYHIVLDN